MSQVRKAMLSVYRPAKAVVYCTAHLGTDGRVHFYGSLTGGHPLR